MCSQSPNRPRELISLGADEVISFNAKTVNEWSRVLAYLLRNEKETKFAFLPSNPPGNAILGSTYALASERIGSVADGVERLNEQGASKILHPSRIDIQIAVAIDKVSLWSIELNSVPEPVADPSRSGKKRSLELPKDSQSVVSPSIEGSGELRDFSSTLTLLIGRKYFEHLDTAKRKKLEDLEKKYSAKLLAMSGNVQVVYGPCLAIEVDSQERELPEFQSDLLSLNSSKESQVSRVAKLSAVTQDLEKVIDELLKSD